MVNTSIELPDEMSQEIDARRETDTQHPEHENRSEYIRNAIRARFNAEDAGEWERPVEVVEA